VVSLNMVAFIKHFNLGVLAAEKVFQTVGNSFYYYSVLRDRYLCRTRRTCMKELRTSFTCFISNSFRLVTIIEHSSVSFKLILRVYIISVTIITFSANYYGSPGGSLMLFVFKVFVFVFKFFVFVFKVLFFVFKVLVKILRNV